MMQELLGGGVAVFPIPYHPLLDTINSSTFKALLGGVSERQRK